MSNPCVAVPESTKASPKLIWTFPDHDDDDDDESVAAPPHERWFSRSGFGAPEWWSRL